MRLSDGRVEAVAAVSDLATAREFYEQRLGLGTVTRCRHRGPFLGCYVVSCPTGPCWLMAGASMVRIAGPVPRYVASMHTHPCVCPRAERQVSTVCHASAGVRIVRRPKLDFNGQGGHHDAPGRPACD